MPWHPHALIQPAPRPAPADPKRPGPDEIRARLYFLRAVRSYRAAR